jgi:glycine/D-amino acid oxidase-like deaminating enzyme
VGTDRVVIVGGSLAGASAARSLRRQGFSGEVLLIGQETHPPYSRPALSKQFLLDSAKGADSLYQPLGVDPATGWLRDSGLSYEERGRIVGGLAVNSPRDCRPLRDLVQRGARFESVVTAAALRSRPAAERET